LDSVRGFARLKELARVREVLVDYFMVLISLIPLKSYGESISCFLPMPREEIISLIAGKYTGIFQFEFGKIAYS